MFLKLLEGILSPRIHFWPKSERQQTNWFSAQIRLLAQYWSSTRIWAENDFVGSRSDSGQKCILGLKILSRSLKNISKYLQDHLRALKSILKKSWKIAFWGHFPSTAWREGPKYAFLRLRMPSEVDYTSKKWIKCKKMLELCSGVSNYPWITIWDIRMAHNSKTLRISPKKHFPKVKSELTGVWASMI